MLLRLLLEKQVLLLQKGQICRGEAHARVSLSVLESSQEGHRDMCKGCLLLLLLLLCSLIIVFDMVRLLQRPLLGEIGETNLPSNLTLQNTL